LLLFLAYWRELRDRLGRLPRRREIDPLAIPRGLLPGIGIFDMLPQPDGGWRIRYRLLGTAHTMAVQRDLTGRYFDEVHPAEELPGLAAEYLGILHSGEPHYIRRRTPLPNHEHIAFSRILAPLLDDDDRPRHLIGYWQWETIARAP
jgi:hypothetical protein